MIRVNNGYRGVLCEMIRSTIISNQDELFNLIIMYISTCINMIKVLRVHLCIGTPRCSKEMECAVLSGNVHYNEPF